MKRKIFWKLIVMILLILSETVQCQHHSSPIPFPYSHKSSASIGTDWPSIEMPIYKEFRLYQHPQFGWQVQKLGDVNGDGYGDIAISTYTDTTFVFFGGPLLDTIPDIVLRGGGGGGGVRMDKIAAGDVNGDGYPDIITSEGNKVTYGLRGCVRLYLNHHTAAMDDSIVYLGKYPMSFLGRMLLSGDVNGDGRTDLIMNSFDMSPSGRGVVYLYLGKEHPDTTEYHAFTVQLPPGGIFTGEFGDDIRVADINGDGCDDIFIHGRSQRGSETLNAWYVYLGNKEAKYGEPDRVIPQVISFNFADINGDNCADFIEVGPGYYPRVIWGNAVVPDIFVCDTVIQNPSVDVFDANMRATQMGDMDGDGIKDYFLTWDVPLIYNGLANFFYRGGKDWNNRATAYFAIMVGVDRCYFNAEPFDIGDVTGDGLTDVAIIAHAFPPPSGDIMFNGIRIYRGAKYLDGVSPMAVDDAKSLSFKITAFPNPLKRSSEQIILDMKLPCSGTLNVRIYDMLGRELYQKEAEIPATGSYVQALPYSFPSAGIYFVQINIGDRFVVKPVSVVE
jgi:hypothetical protein